MTAMTTITETAGPWTVSVNYLPDGSASLFIETNVDARTDDGNLLSFGFHCPDVATTALLYSELYGAWEMFSIAAADTLPVQVTIGAGRDGRPVEFTAATEEQATVWWQVFHAALYVVDKAGMTATMKETS